MYLRNKPSFEEKKQIFGAKCLPRKGASSFKEANVSVTKILLQSLDYEGSIFEQI